MSREGLDLYRGRGHHASTMGKVRLQWRLPTKESSNPRSTDELQRRESKLPRLFSYVVDHDNGFAPNPSGGICTLAKCKYGTKKRNIVEMAKKGDWIAGTGGVDLSKSAGHGKLIYAMRVDKKLSLAEYCRTYEGDRVDAKHDIPEKGRFALISRQFFYFGCNAIDISEIPQKHLDHDFEKSGRGYVSDFSPEFVGDFASWLERTFKMGVHGSPCKPLSAYTVPRCKPKVKRKRRCP